MKDTRLSRVTLLSCAWLLLAGCKISNRRRIWFEPQCKRRNKRGEHNTNCSMASKHAFSLDSFSRGNWINRWTEMFGWFPENCLAAIPENGLPVLVDLLNEKLKTWKEVETCIWQSVRWRTERQINSSVLIEKTSIWHTWRFHCLKIITYFFPCQCDFTSTRRYNINVVCSWFALYFLETDS